MSIQRLAILGILKSGPKHGYQIKKIIDKVLGVFAELEEKSVYYSLKKMEEEKLIRKEIGTVSKHLQRYTYYITEKGEKEFVKLAMSKFIPTKRPFFEIDIPLYFLPYLNKREVLVRLRLRKRFLDSVKSWIKRVMSSDKNISQHHKLLLKHHLQLLKAEDKFIDDFIKMVKT